MSMPRWNAVLAPWVRQLGLRAEAVDDQGVTLRLPFE